MEYFSDQEKGAKTRSLEEIPDNVWGGIVAIIKSHIDSGAFGDSFPDICPDGGGPVGTDEKSFELAVKAEVPNIDWPLRVKNKSSWDDEINIPDYLSILDLIQFCYEHVAKPIQDSYHDFFKHYHLSFDQEEGKKEYRLKINRIFARNGLAYELDENGNIIRLLPPVIDKLIDSSVLTTNDRLLNELLNQAFIKFCSPDKHVRKEALEKLWDSWERLKSLNNSNKKESIKILLDNCSSEPNFRELLEKEARSLTDIGNSFHIRHTEVDQILIKDTEHIDYLFHRLLCMIYLMVKKMV